MHRTKDIQQVIAALNQGQLVVIPTETVYGLAGNAFDDQSIQEIFRVKGRPSNNPLIVHISDISELSRIAQNIPEKALRLAQKFWPGPLTLIFEKQAYISDFASANLSTIAVRIPNHPMTLELLSKIDFPLVAPSANRSNHISPTKPEHVLNSLGDQCPLILDGGPCAKGIESTIVGFQKDSVIIYRKGVITKEEIEEFLQEVVLDLTHSEQQNISPGSSKKHYAPKTPVQLVNDLNAFELEDNRRIGALYFGNKPILRNFDFVRNLSTLANFEEAAAQVYDALYDLDEQNLDLILIELLPENGIGASINDRLRRSASN